MIEDFSGGYYRATMTVQPVEDGPCIERGLYDLIDQRLYKNTDAPVTMRLRLDGGPSFLPHGEGAMPTDVVGVPVNMLDEMGVHPSAENVSTFILKPEYAYLLHEARTIGNSFQNIDMSLLEEDRDFFDLRHE